MPEKPISRKSIPIVVIEESLYEVKQKIYPRAVTGIFARWRYGMIFFTQLLFYGLPWLSWNQRQAFLLDLVQRKFYIFGLVLWPQDVIYLTLFTHTFRFSPFSLYCSCRTFVLWVCMSTNCLYRNLYVDRAQD